MKKDFIKSNLFTGFITLLPLSLLIVVLVWLYGVVSNIVNPISKYFGLTPFFNTILAILSLLVIVFLIGLTMRTRIGNWIFKKNEDYILHKLPGYKLIKDIIKPFTGKGYQKSFQSVALVNLYENSVLVTAFVTDKNMKKGYTTIFIPTGPNPTSGQIVHMKNKYVHPIDIKVETVLKSVVAVGSGSSKIIDKMKK